MIIDIKNLNLFFENDGKKIHALKNINIQLEQGKVLGIAGESGCGKTLTSLAIMDLLPQTASYSADRFIFNGTDLLKMNSKKRHSLRGLDLSMIFQDPMASLNPSLTIKTQILESLKRASIKDHSLTKKSNKQYLLEAVNLLKLVGLTSPEKRLNSYPFELSGGMCQRVMIAIALSCKPKILIADEPTTGLDVTIQSQILALLKNLQKELNLSIIFISHDLSILAHFCDQINVMYSGTIVEKNSSREIIKNPIHPYTKGLLSCLPSNNNSSQSKELAIIDGIVPEMSEVQQGCCFKNRCPYKIDQCESFTSKEDSTQYYNCLLNIDQLRENKWT